MVSLPFLSSFSITVSVYFLDGVEATQLPLRFFPRGGGSLIGLHSMVAWTTWSVCFWLRDSGYSKPSNHPNQCPHAYGRDGIGRGVAWSDPL